MAGVRYVRSGGARIAWDAMGSGRDLVVVANFATNMDSMLALAETREWFERVSQSFRVVVFDQRGTGLSERGTVAHGLDTWLGDLEAVLDAADVERAVLFAVDFSVPVTIAFAARHPERVSAAVLHGGFARLVNKPGYDAGIPEAARGATVAMVIEGWGDSHSLFARLGVPGDGPDRDREREAVARVQRLAANPSEVETTVQAMFDLDVTDQLDRVHVPALILHRRDDHMVPLSQSRYLAKHLPQGELHELPGDEHFMFLGDSEQIIEEIESFVGVTPTARRTTTELAVVWYADIVSSTEAVAQVGNLNWRRRLDEFDSLASFHVTHHNGRIVKHLGDGVLAVFRSARGAARAGIRFQDACSSSGFGVRVGMDAGDIEIRPDGDVAGIAVHSAQRVQSLASPGEVIVTGPVRHLLLGTTLGLAARGSHVLKGFDEPVELYTVTIAR